MKQSVFLDTDVVLDFLAGRQPFMINSAKIFSLAQKGEINIFISPLTFSNCYYILRKVAKHDKVISKLVDLLDFVDVTRMNKRSVEQALKSDFKDFEDALQNYSAIENDKIVAILTRNLKDYKKSEISVMSPETYLISKSANT